MLMGATSVDPGRAGPGRILGFGANGAHRLLELSGREVKVGLHFGSEVGVVLEAQTLRNHLKGKAFRHQAARKKHPVPPEKLLRAEPRNPLDRVLELAVAQFEGLGNAGHGEPFGFGQLKEIGSSGANEMLASSLEFEGFVVAGHGFGGENYRNFQKILFFETLVKCLRTQ